MRAEVNLYDFTHYRSFLQADFEARKKKNPAWSHGAWAKRLSLKSNTSILKIIHGQREAGPQIINKLIGFYEFNPNERSYFKNLVKLAKLKNDPETAVLIMEKMSNLHPKKKFRLLNDREFLAISHWWFYAIREMVLLKDFEEDPDWIAKRLRFKLTPREVKKAIEVLLEIHLLKRDPNGTLLPTEQWFESSDGVISEGLKRFHEGVLECAQSAVRKVDLGIREIGGSTFAIRKEQIPKAIQLLKKMRRDFAEAIEAGTPSGKGDEVYHIEVLFFPLTKPLLKSEIRSK